MRMFSVMALINRLNIMMMKILLLLLAVTATLCDVCTEPQRIFYMSYSSLGKRDALGNLFLELDSKITPISTNYTDTNLQANFKIPSILLQTYYNDHHQNEAFLDRYKVNVTLGDVAIGTYFNYSIDYSSKNKSGTIFARGRLDPSYFTKNLTMSEGYIEWAPDVVPAFTFTQFITIEASEPKLTEPQLEVFTKMLNNQAGARRVKEEIVQQINGLYGSLLKQHLNHQDLISTNNITYKYRNITLNIQNLAKEFYLSNGNTKGLEAFFLYGLPSSKENCTILGKEFDEDEYGGLQEIVSFGIVRSMIKEALTQGLYDVTLDRTWETPGFQLFMGDLGNSVPYANYAPAGDRFNVSCSFDATRAESELKIARYEDKQIYVSVPENCQIVYNSKPILALKMDVNFVVELVAAEQSIKAIVRSTGIFGASFTSLDANYRVESPVLAQHSITEILNGLVGKQLFGSNFPAIYRRYPVLRILDDRIVIFDPSEQ